MRLRGFWLALVLVLLFVQPAGARPPVVISIVLSDEILEVRCSEGQRADAKKHDGGRLWTLRCRPTYHTLRGPT